MVLNLIPSQSPLVSTKNWNITLNRIMDHLFTKELELGHISKLILKPVLFTPIGRLPKKNSRKTRPITDCSRPYGSSLIDHFKGDLVSFRMNSVDNAALCSSPNCFHSIVDIESA